MSQPIEEHKPPSTLAGIGIVVRFEWRRWLRGRRGWDNLLRLAGGVLVGGLFFVFLWLLTEFSQTFQNHEGNDLLCALQFPLRLWSNEQGFLHFAASIWAAILTAKLLLPGFAALAFARERELGRLDFLRQTLLSPTSLFWGKKLAVALFFLPPALLIPLFFLDDALWAGTPTGFAVLMWLDGATQVLLAAAVSVAISALCTRTRTAIALAYLFVWLGLPITFQIVMVLTTSPVPLDADLPLFEANWAWRTGCHFLTSLLVLLAAWGVGTEALKDEELLSLPHRLLLRATGKLGNWATKQSLPAHSPNYPITQLPDYPIAQLLRWLSVVTAMVITLCLFAFAACHHTAFVAAHFSSKAKLPPAALRHLHRAADYIWLNEPKKALAELKTLERQGFGYRREVRAMKGDAFFALRQFRKAVQAYASAAHEPLPPLSPSGVILNVPTAWAIKMSFRIGAAQLAGKRVEVSELNALLRITRPGPQLERQVVANLLFSTVWQETRRTFFPVFLREALQLCSWDWQMYESAGFFLMELGGRERLKGCPLCRQIAEQLPKEAKRYLEKAKRLPKEPF